MKVAGVVPALPSVIAAGGGAIDTTGRSSLVMVPTPVSSPIVALPGVDSSRERPSFGSTAVSPATSTVTVLAVSPAANVSEPDDAV